MDRVAAAAWRFRMQPLLAAVNVNAGVLKALPGPMRADASGWIQ